MSQALETVLTLWGPLAMGWVLAGLLAWYCHKIHREYREDLRRLNAVTRSALENNTKVLTALNVRLEERARS